MTHYDLWASQAIKHNGIGYPIFSQDAETGDWLYNTIVQKNNSACNFIWSLTRYIIIFLCKLAMFCILFFWDMIIFPRTVQCSSQSALQPHRYQHDVSTVLLIMFPLKIPMYIHFSSDFHQTNPTLIICSGDVPQSNSHRYF